MDHAQNPSPAGPGGLLLALTTFPNEEVACQIGTTLVKKQCIACINLLPKATSIYRWKDVIETDTEVVAIMKTTQAGLATLESTLVELHPYDCPELLTFNVTGGLLAYLQWLASEVR